MNKKSLVILLPILWGVTLQADDLMEQFVTPPDSAKPQTWWDWIDGNITKAGIAADLEAMKQIGLGGATIVNVDSGIPAGPVKFMSLEWREDIQFAAQEANRLGLQLGLENCAGWSNSGGPWNTPTNAMKCLTSGETRVHGPTVFDGFLPQPPVTLGFYRDIAVFAFKVSPAVSLSEVVSPAVAGTAPAKLVIKSAFYEAADGAKAEDGGGSADVTAKVVSLVNSGHKSISATSGELACDPAIGQVKRLRVDFTLDGQQASITVGESGTLALPETLSQWAAMQVQEKDRAVDLTFVRPPPNKPADAGEAIPLDGIVDLTSKLAAGGKLRWDVPAGDWVLLRLGYTANNVSNHPAPKEGTGLECDKLDAQGIDGHWAGFMEKVIEDLGPNGITSSLIDSYEVGSQDWSANFREEFIKRRGYDPVKYLPAFTRRVVENPEVTERFLWDMRRTIADLFAENYYGRFAELCRQYHLSSTIEPYYGPYESIPCGASADVVMGEFWTGSHGHPTVKMASSIAHIHGKTLVGAEAYTTTGDAGQWKNDPYSLKTLGDLMFCQGLNRYYFHRFAMQPWTNHCPGMTMGEYGLHFERTQTWWQPGKAWIDYLTRCEFMLQQGHAVADIACFDGQSSPVQMRVANPARPDGYDFDAVDASVLQNATVKNGRLALASGANYAVLVLPPDDPNMTPKLLKRIGELVRSGATVVGVRPQHSPSLADYPACDAEVTHLADALWGSCDGTNILEHACGQGRIVWGKSLANVLNGKNLKPDFEAQSASSKAQVTYNHRVVGKTDIYFVSNQREHFESADCTFRVDGKVPELWHPDTSTIEPAPIWSVKDGRTVVRLNFDPEGSVFVVFREAEKEKDHFVVPGNGFSIEPVSVTKLQIQHAAYAAMDGTGEVDVTKKISELVDDDQLKMVARTEAFNSDPAPYHVKQLRVDYTLDDHPGHKTVREGDTLTLGSVVKISDWQAGIAADGSPVVKVSHNVRINLQTVGGKVLELDVTNVPPPEEIGGPWKLEFPSGWGAPPSVTLNKLISWSDHTNDGVRYFSGTATYEKKIEISAERLESGRELWLDLGEVKNLAEVYLNGQDVGILWKPPFRVDLTKTAKPGTNNLVVKVTNLWPNRLIGDEQLPADADWDGGRLKVWPQWLLNGKSSPARRYTFATWKFYSKDSPLLESGLLGPVLLNSSITFRPSDIVK